MMSFLMAIVTFITRIREQALKKKIDAKSKYHKSKKRLDEKYIGGDNPYNKKAEDYVRESSEKKDKKKLTKTRVLGFITSIIAVLETIPTFFTIISWSMLLILVIIVVVVLFSILGILNGLDDFCGKEESGVGSKTESSSSSSTSSVSSGDGLLAWTDEELASKGKSLSNYEKNMYRLGIVANKTLSGALGEKKMSASKADIEDKILISLGLVSIESGMRFFSDESKGNVFKQNVINNVNSLGYGFMGLKSNEKLSNYYKAGTVSKIKKEFVSPGGSEISYAPYGVAISIGHQNSKLYPALVTKANSASSKAAKIFGFTGDLKDYYQGVFLLFTMQHAYLSYHPELVDNEAIYAAGILDVSADSSGSKSFKNYIPKGSAYDESTYRFSYTGNRGAIKKSNNVVYMQLNGKDLNKSLPDYALAKLSGDKKKAFSEVVSGSGPNTLAGSLSRGNANTIGQSYYYGLNSYLMANKIESNLAKKMNITKKESTSKDDKKEEKTKTESKKDTASLTNSLERTGKSMMDFVNPIDTVNASKESFKVLRTITVESTAYLPTCPGCSGVTATGIDVRNWSPNLIAVDPRVIALNTVVKLYLGGKFLGYYVAADTGGAIKGNIIDILVKDSAHASQWGRRHGLKAEITDKKFSSTSAAVKWLKANESSSNKGVIPFKNGITDNTNDGGSATAKNKSAYLTKKSNIFMVGDSITVGVEKEMKKTFTNMTIDAKVGRQMSEAQSILKQAKKDKKFGDGVIIALGTNGEFKQSLLETYVELVPKDTPVILVNTYNKLKWGDKVNSILSSVAKKYSNVTLADWNSIAKPDYISSDNVHHNSTGQAAYVKFLTAEILKTDSLQETGNDDTADTSSSKKPTSSSSGSDCEDGGTKKEKGKKEEDDDDDKNTEKSASKVTPGKFKETPGKSQSGIKINGKTPEQMAQAVGASDLVKHFGTSSYLQGKGKAVTQGYKDPYYGVPFYGQGSWYQESYGNASWGANTFNWSGCMHYAHSYVLSAFTGKMINPAESNVIFRYTGASPGGLMGRGNLQEVYKHFKLKSKVFSSGKASFGEFGGIVSKGGLVVVRAYPPYATNTHFFVINGYKKTAKGEFYHLYTSSHVEQSVTWEPRAKLQGAMYAQSVAVWK